MNAIQFPESNTIIAKYQPQYRPLPAYVADGKVTICWELTPEQKKQIVETGVFWHKILTFGAPLHNY